MGVTSENYPGNNPVPPITPSVNVAQAITDDEMALVKQTSVKKAKPYEEAVLKDLGD